MTKFLKMVLTRLREKKLTLNRHKCEFTKSSLIFMSHVLSSESIRISESKIHAVRDEASPKNANDVL